MYLASAGGRGVNGENAAQLSEGAVSRGFPDPPAARDWRVLKEVLRSNKGLLVSFPMEDSLSDNDRSVIVRRRG